MRPLDGDLAKGFGGEEGEHVGTHVEVNGVATGFVCDLKRDRVIYVHTYGRRQSRVKEEERSKAGERWVGKMGLTMAIFFVPL